jgi:hypothetical protein
MSGAVVATATALSGVLVYVFTSALSNPYPIAGRGDWIIQTAAAAPAPAETAQVAQVAFVETPAPLAAQTIITRSVVTERIVAPAPVPAPVKTRAATEKAFGPRWELAGVSREIKLDDTPTTGSVRLALADESTPVAAPSSPRASAVAVPAEATRIKPERKVEAQPPRKINPLEEVDRYLWAVYERTPIKKDNSGDFTWKDPAAAKRMHLSLKDYVIGGMEPDFREQLYHTGKALDAAGYQWSMLSAFRDDYRQTLAAGFKARTGNSQHGGSRAVGGYGHGRAIDIMNTSGEDEAVWHWLDAHGARYGIRRPMPGYDPAHIQAGGDWHSIAASLRDNRTRAAAAKRPGNEAAVKTKNAKTAM